jgi:dTDP-4-amino-4,6-dideoxygalactose transaminase
MLQKISMIVPVVTPEEKQGHMSHVLTKIPNVCAELALYSLGKIRALNERRRTLTAFFARHGRDHNWPMLSGVYSDFPLQKFPLFVLNARAKREVLKRENIHLDDGWTGCVICPEDIELTETGYEQGMDPAAERVCRQILSLPTHPTMTLFQAERLARRIDMLLAEKKS